MAPISAYNYATFKPNLYFCWSLPLIGSKFYFFDDDGGRKLLDGQSLTLVNAGFFFEEITRGGGGGGKNTPPPFEARLALFDQFFLPTSYFAET